MNEEDKKPVVFNNSTQEKYRPDTYIQNLLLKALSDGITDVSELVKITGARNATQVMVAFDKLSIRKDYHKALSSAGLSMDIIVDGLKELAVNSNSEAIKLKTLQTLMKSLGLEKYEKDEESANSWEELILQAADKDALPEKIVDAESEEVKEVKEEEVIEKYVIEEPPIPDSVIKRQKDEKELAKQLYS